jgi:predicted exporter
MRRRIVPWVIWLGLMALGGLLIARAHYTADLSAFLPATPSKTQQFLVGQLKEGLASRLILVDIEGADDVMRAAASRELARRLRQTADFRSVLNGEALSFNRDRDFLVEHRYLLSDHMTADHFEVAGLHSAIADSIDLLSSSMGLIAQDLFVRDPTGETLQATLALGQLDRQPRLDHGVWISADGRRALLIAETRANGSDSDAQERAIELIRSDFNEARAAVAKSLQRPLTLQMTGPGVFAVQARTMIQHQAIRLSLLSSLFIATLLLWVYRSLPVLILGLLPVITGAVAGVAAVSLGFGVVHGVTLGFGVTLIGEAVDYSVYLFIQARTATLWPTIRLGMLCSICGFATLIPSAFPGLAQLGVYSIAGLLAAGLATRFVLPNLIPKGLTVNAALPLGHTVSKSLNALRSWRGILWGVPIVACAALFVNRGHLWNRELSALSPVPVAEQTLDAELRADLGAPDVRTLIVLSGKSAEQVLVAGETVGKALDQLITQGVIASYQSPDRYLPSQFTQNNRRASLPNRVAMAARLHEALEGLPVRAERLRQFLEDVESARAGPLIQRSDLEGTSLASGVDALLLPTGNEWHALMPLKANSEGPHAYSIDTAAVKRVVESAKISGAVATVLDLKVESDALYSGYLQNAQRLSLLGFGMIILLLTISLRSMKRVFRVVAPLILAVLTVITGFAAFGRSLTLLHLVGLLLVVAIGSNYALFFDRESLPTTPEVGSRILASLLVANLTTVIGFGTLGFSTLPVLSALGATVAPGTLLALLFSAVLSAPPKAVSV